MKQAQPFVDIYSYLWICCAVGCGEVLKHLVLVHVQV